MMSLTEASYVADTALARELAASAGSLLRATRSSGLLQGKSLGAAGDAVAQAFLSRALQEQRSEDAILSEEAVDDPSRLSAERVWIIDPLDGTREYSEYRHDWAVHVALTVAGQPVASAVSIPALDEVLTSHNVVLADRDPNRPLRLTASRSRPASETQAVAAALGADVVAMGSAGFKAMAVVRGAADVYLHSGGQWEWDTCAPVGVARAAGLHVSRIDGSRMVFNKVTPSTPDLLLCRPELADRILTILAGQPR